MRSETPSYNDNSYLALKNITLPTINSLQSHGGSICFGGKENCEAKTQTVNKADKNKFYCQKICQIRQNFLRGKGIKSAHRMQIKLWFMTEMKKNDIYRETYAVASRLLDQYFAKGEDIHIKSFQNLGISCFMIASKVNQGQCPKFAFESYGLDQILRFELKICEVLNYEIFPITYFHLAEALMAEWDKFIGQIENPAYFRKNGKSITNYRKIMDVLQIIDLTPYIYSFKLQEVVLNSFYLQNYLFICQSNQEYKQDFQKNTKNFVNLYLAKNKYNKLFQQFLSSLRSNQYFFKSNISEQVLRFLQKFIQIQFVYTGKGKNRNHQLQSMRELEHRFLMLMINQNPNHQPFVRSILKK